MKALCIPLIGPMQSWGSRSNFSDRDCERTPTKSGVIGIVASAMGLERGSDLARFRNLGFGVRCEREGSIRREFQTALDVAKADGKPDKNPQVSTRYYLADAAFVAVLCGDESLIKEIHAALKAPVWQPFLGRRSYIPSIPIFDPIGPFDADSLKAALLARPLIMGTSERARIRLEYDSSASGFTLRMDEPLSFCVSRRAYAARHVKTEFIDAATFPGGVFIAEVGYVS